MAVKLFRLLTALDATQIKTATGLDAYLLPSGDIAYLSVSDATAESAILAGTVMGVKDRLVRLSSTDAPSVTALETFAKAIINDAITSFELTMSTAVPPAVGDYASRIIDDPTFGDKIVKVETITGIVGEEVAIVHGIHGSETIDLKLLMKVNSFDGIVELTGIGDVTEPVVIA